MPLVRPVRSSVVPDGTATDDSTMVEQEVFDLLAEEAPPEPEKVQVVARLSRSGAAVGAGAALPTGFATTAQPSKATVVRREESNMVTGLSELESRLQTASFYAGGRRRTDRKVKQPGRMIVLVPVPSPPGHCHHATLRLHS